MKLKRTHLILISLSKRFYGSRQIGRAANCPNHPMAQMLAWARLPAGRAGCAQHIFCSLVRSGLKACWQPIVKLSFCLSFSSSFNKRFLLRAFLVLGCWATVDRSPAPPVRKRGFAARCPLLPVRSKGHTQRRSPVTGALRQPSSTLALLPCTLERTPHSWSLPVSIETRKNLFFC